MKINWLLPGKARWRKSNWASKFAIICGYAGLIWIIYEGIKDMLVIFSESDDRYGAITYENTEFIKKRLLQLETILQQNSLSADTTSYVGYSVNVMVILYREQHGNTSYIFDFGNSLAGIRFSLYLNIQNELCYRIVDAKNNVRTIAIDTMTGNFNFDELIFITCEYGETEGNSFQRILINGREVEKHTFATNLKLSEAAVRLPGTIGADFTAENCAKIFIGAYILLHSTLTGKETLVLSEATRNFLNAVDFKNQIETGLLNCDKYYYIDPISEKDEIRYIK